MTDVAHAPTDCERDRMNAVKLLYKVPLSSRPTNNALLVDRFRSWLQATSCTILSTSRTCIVGTLACFFVPYSFRQVYFAQWSYFGSKYLAKNVTGPHISISVRSLYNVQEEGYSYRKQIARQHSCHRNFCPGRVVWSTLITVQNLVTVSHTARACKGSEGPVP